MQYMADNSHEMSRFIFYEKYKNNIVQTIHMKCQLIFFEKYKKKNYKQFI